jgi:hypothetical protein
VSLSGSLVLAMSDIPAAPVVGMMTLGVVIALVGHMAKSYRVVAVGLAILFVATALMVVVGLAAYNDDPADPRPQEDRSKPF